MKQLILTILFLLIFNVSKAQDHYSKISLSGFKVEIIPADYFKIDIKCDVEIEQEVEDGVLSILVLDQRGRVPKGELVIYTNKLHLLELHNSQLVMNSYLNQDSLTLITASSFGELKVKTKYLSINLGGGSKFKIEGSATFFDCAVGASSRLNATTLIAEKADVEIIGYAQASVNVKDIEEQIVENSSFQNIHRED